MPMISIFFLLFSFQSFAVKRLSSETFQINVRPVINGIINDFYQMVGLFPDFPKETSPIIFEVESLTDEGLTLKEKCPGKISHSCQANLKQLKSRLDSLSLRCLRLLSSLRAQDGLQLHFEGAIRTISNFQTEVEEFKGMVENLSLVIKARTGRSMETLLLIKRIDELNAFSSMLLIENIPQLYREDFRQFFFNFVRPLQHQMARKTNFEYMNKNVTELNFHLNLLNQNLTKRSKKTPEGMGPYLVLMHNRWNNILRFYY
jgi:hypothetical protein